MKEGVFRVRKQGNTAKGERKEEEKVAEEKREREKETEEGSLPVQGLKKVLFACSKSIKRKF
jgi:hypothetical protein